MKKTKKVISLILSVCCAFGAASCSKEPAGTPVGPSGPTDNSVYLDGVKLPNAAEKAGVSYTNAAFITNGKSEYKIVIDKNCGEYVRFAANEIQTFVRKASGANLTVDYADQAVWSNSAKYIVLGNNEISKASGVTVPDGLGKQGFLLKTVGSSVIISGKEGDLGTLNGTYEFLSKQIGYECYAADNVYVDDIKTVNLISVDMTDKPDVPNYIATSGMSNEVYAKRMRVVNSSDVLGTSTITPYHNALDYLPPSKHYAEHAEWYNALQTQLCYTAHGDEEQYAAMVDTLFNKMLDEVENHDLKVVTFTLEDNYDYCTCAACTAAEAEYGAKSGLEIKVCNDISDKFAEYYAEHNPGKSVDILFFAYYFFTAAPDSTKIRCNSNVAPLIAPLNEMNRAKNIHSVENTGIYNTIEAWKKVCEKFGFWIYSANFYDYFVPSDVFTPVQDNYKYFSELNPIYFFDQGPHSTHPNQEYSNWETFYRWLASKIAWNVNADVEALTREYFEHNFQAAAEPMYKYYLSFRAKLTQLNKEDPSYTPNFGVSCLSQQYFKLGTLQTWSGFVEEALAAIEPLKTTDKETYERIKVYITRESVSVQYLTIKLYNSYFSASVLAEMKQKFYDDCRLASIRSYGEHRPIENVF